MLPGAVEFALAAVGARVFGTFAEYFIHRAMHWGILHPEGFLVSLTSGLGWMLGALAYAALASYSHQIQHANADLVFWMKRPVHRLHHNLDMRDRNFGVLVDWWDRLFGTYQPVEYPRASRRHAAREFLAIPWR